MSKKSKPVSGFIISKVNVKKVALSARRQPPPRRTKTCVSSISFSSQEDAVA